LPTPILPSITLGLFLAGGLARLVRYNIIEVMAQDDIRTAYANGLTTLRMVAKHAMRNENSAPLLIVITTFVLGCAILFTATLSFLGLGAQPPTPEWGAMLNAGREHVRYGP
jgi:peptide/nickel transport system permease protein